MVKVKSEKAGISDSLPSTAVWFVFCVSFARLFFDTLWSPTGIGLTSWLSFVMFNYVLSLSHVVSWVRCGT